MPLSFTNSPMLSEFASTIDPVPGGNPYFPNQWSAYDTFLRDKDGNAIIDAGFNLNQVIFDAASVGGTGNGVYFGGANAVAANGGNPVALYSPTTFEPGSSVSHLDKNVFPIEMMKHDRDFGPQEARDAEETQSADALRERMIESYQTQMEVDEPEEDQMALLMGNGDAVDRPVSDDMSEEKMLRALMEAQGGH